MAGLCLKTLLVKLPPFPISIQIIEIGQGGEGNWVKIVQTFEELKCRLEMELKLVKKGPGDVAIVDILGIMLILIFFMLVLMGCGGFLLLIK